MMKDAQIYVRDYLATHCKGEAHWFYEDGCVLRGCEELYCATGEALYRDFILDYMARAVDGEGHIRHFPTAQQNLDNINAGKTLLFALDETGDARYRRAADFLMDRLATHPRCDCGNYWHKDIYPHQVWLDGLYMAQPFRLAYTLRFGGGRDAADVLAQFANARRLLFDPAKGLYFHACDTRRVQPWADPATGRSPNFWLRAIGWHLLALVDCAQLLPEEPTLKALFREAAEGVARRRDGETGLFHQIIDRPDVPGNYIETSGSAMVIAARLKGARLGIIPACGDDLDAFERLTREKLLPGEDGKRHLTGICRSAGLGPGSRRDGSVAYYLSEPIVSDDGKGVGPFMMALAEYRRAKK